jgi:hypothetical protein
MTTQMRSGTHWTLDIIEQLTGIKWMFIRFGWLVKPSKIQSLCKGRNPAVWCMHNADPRMIVENLSDGTLCLTSVRNPWDQFVSLGFYIRYNPYMPNRRDLYPLYYVRDDFGHTHLNDKEWLNKLAFSPLIEFFYEKWKMYNSFDHKKLYKVSYDELSEAPLFTIRRLAEHIRQPKKNYHDVHRFTTFHRKTGRQKGNNNGKWKFRNFGESGTYKRFLTRETVDYIEEKVQF